MKTKLLLLLLMLLLVLHKPIWTLASPYPLAPSPQGPPFSPFPNSMSASSPAIVMGAEEQQIDSHKKMVIAIAVASTSLGAVILSVLCIWIYHTKYPSKSKGKNVQRSDAEKGLASSPTLSKFSSIKLVGKKGCVPIIDYKQIEKVTGNYKESNILGEGGFGCVYKAHLADNLEVAVKKLHCENQYAEQEYENEVELLSKIQHPNVISLLGCSSNEDTRIIVYELMHNGSLKETPNKPHHPALPHLFACTGSIFLPSSSPSSPKPFPIRAITPSSHTQEKTQYNTTLKPHQSQIYYTIFMAVEARHLNLFPSQLLTNRQLTNSVDANINMYNAQQIGYSSFLPSSGALTEPVLPSSVYNSLGNAVKSESGLTYNNSNSAVVPPMSRKRSRENYSYNDSFSFLGQDVSLQIQQQQLDIEHLIMQRMEKVRIEIDQKRKRQARRVIEAIEVGVMKKLKAKEEEIEKIGKLNWALEEKVKSLCMENQIWRDLAQTNEATANALRCNLEQVLAQRGMVDDGTAALMDDAQSCCGSTDEDGEGEKEVEWRTVAAGCAGVKDKEDGGCEKMMIGESSGRLCRNCGKEESCVLILPCRHLCLCTVCGSTLHICPICKSFKTASVHVNMS